MKKIKIGKYEIRMKVYGDSISVRVHHFGSELPFVGTILYQNDKDTTNAEMWAISKINQDIEGKQKENVLSPRKKQIQDKHAIELLNACKNTFHGLCNMTTEEFSKGADKSIRESLKKLIEKVEQEVNT